MSTQIVTGKVRLSYANIDEPRAFEGQEPKYSATLLIPKTDKKTTAKIMGAIKAAREAFTAKNPSVKLPDKHTLYDGDGTRPNGEEFGPECKGHLVITVSSKTKPALVNIDKTPATEPGVFYSGCYARAVINFYAYNTAGNRGVTAGLNGLMKLADGERLGGGGVSADKWDEDWDDAWDDEADSDTLDNFDASWL